MSPAGDRRSAGQGPSSTEYLGLAGMLAAAVLVPLVIGLAAGARLHHTTLFFFIGLFLGVIAAVAVVYTRFKPYL